MTTSSKTELAGVIGVAGVLVGTVVGYGAVVSGNDPAPQGWLLCDGSAVSRTTYACLYSVLGDIHGSGDGTSTFNLPDYRGRFQRGVDDGSGRDPDAGSRTPANPGGLSGDRVGSVQPRATGLPAGDRFASNHSEDHHHWVPNLPDDNSHPWAAGSHYADWNDGSRDTSNNGWHTHGLSGGDQDSCPVNLYQNYLIFYGTRS